MHTTNTQQLLTMVFDQGSHASRIALFSETGQLVYLQSEKISTYSPEQGRFEQDANEILDSLLKLVEALPTELSNTIRNCCMCTQRSSVVAWHKQTGAPLSPVISWRDLRNQRLLDTMKTSGLNIQKITGLPLSAHYSAAKIHWLLHNNKEVKHAAEELQLCIAPVSSFLLFHLLENQPFIIDHSNAQRSLLFNIVNLDWSAELLDLFQINRHFLPDCQPVIYNYGKLKHLNIPMTAVSGDQNAALHAYPSMQENNALINIGTGAFVLSTSTEINDPAKLLRSITSSQNNHVQYITEGTVNGAGNAISWATNKFNINAEPANEKNVFTQLPGWLNTCTSPPVFINTVSGLGSPWWCSGGAADIIYDNEPTQAEYFVAIIESIIFLLFNNIQQLKQPPETIFISGGLAQLDGLCQKLADLSQAKVQRFTETETSARGCAWLANQLDHNVSAKHHLLWQELMVETQFNPVNNPEILQRYQQLVGELQKRCYND